MCDEDIDIHKLDNRYFDVPPFNLLFSRKVDEGSFGCVYRCIDTYTDAVYACKVMDKEKNADTWEREVSNLLDMYSDDPNHEFVMHAFACAKTPSTIFLVLPYLGGGTLLDKVMQQRRFPEAEARRVLLQIARGIEYLHSKGICHRDLKLDNILCSEEENYRVVICDFGFSKKIRQGLHTGNRGTLEYMAPEVLEATGEEDYDEKCDIWSYGVIVYTVLTGCFPFYVVNPDESVNREKTAALIARGAYNTGNLDTLGVSPEAREFIASLLVVDPSARPTAQQITSSSFRAASWLCSSMKPGQK